VALAPNAATSPPDAGPTVTQAPVVPFTVEGVDILNDPPDERTAQIVDALALPGRAISAVILGSMAGNQAIGVQTDAGDVCLNVTFAVETSGGGGTGDCVSLSEFQANGLVIDRGYWGVSWLPDGSVAWDGL